MLAAGADLTVLAGDPNQAVFGFRGADPELLRLDTPAIVLTASHRCSVAVADAIGAVAARLPGADRPRALTGAADRAGAVAVRIAASPHAEATRSPMRCAAPI